MKLLNTVFNIINVYFIEEFKNNTVKCNKNSKLQFSLEFYIHQQNKI